MPEIQDSSDRELQKLREIRDDWKAFCETQSDTPPPPPAGSQVAVSPREECLRNVNRFYDEAVRRVTEARTKAIQQSWDEAYKAKKDYEEWLRKQIQDVNIPGIIRDVIKPLLPAASITVSASGQISGITTANGVEDGDLNLSGSFSLSDGGVGYNESGTLLVKLSISGTLTTATPNGKVYSGTIQFVTNSGATWTAIVETDDRNRLQVDANGAATVTLLLKGVTSVKGWGSVLPAYPRIQLKLVRSSTGLFQVAGNSQPTSAFFDHDPCKITDYNGDGVRQYAVDYAAFLSGQAAHAPKADVNEDGAWDAVDTDLWLRLFAEDVP